MIKVYRRKRINVLFNPALKYIDPDEPEISEEESNDNFYVALAWKIMLKRICQKEIVEGSEGIVLNDIEDVLHNGYCYALYFLDEGFYSHRVRIPQKYQTGEKEGQYRYKEIKKHGEVVGVKVVEKNFYFSMPVKDFQHAMSLGILKAASEWARNFKTCSLDKILFSDLGQLNADNTDIDSLGMEKNFRSLVKNLSKTMGKNPFLQRIYRDRLYGNLDWSEIMKKYNLEQNELSAIKRQIKKMIHEHYVKIIA